MINLASMNGEMIHIQLSTQIYFIGGDQSGRLGPMPYPEEHMKFLPDGRLDPSSPLPKPMMLTQMSGLLHMEGEQPILIYPNPLNPTVSIRMAIDPAVVCAAWSQPPIRPVAQESSSSSS